MFSFFFDIPSIWNNVCKYFKTPSVEAVSVEVEDQSEKFIKEAEADGQESSAIKKNKVGFRDRKIVEYENRLRHYSSP